METRYALDSAPSEHTGVTGKGELTVNKLVWVNEDWS